MKFVCVFTGQREDEVFEGICWETVTERLTCTQPFASRHITFTECCCLFGDAWGMDCALCPQKNTGINTQPSPMSTFRIYWCLFTSISKSMVHWVPVYINVYIKCHTEQYTLSITISFGLSYMIWLPCNYILAQSLRHKEPANTKIDENKTLFFSLSSSCLCNYV